MKPRSAPKGAAHAIATGICARSNRPWRAVLAWLLLRKQSSAVVVIPAPPIPPRGVEVDRQPRRPVLGKCGEPMIKAAQQARPGSIDAAHRISILMNLIAAPFIYAVLIPLALLDSAAGLYQAVCFPIWRIDTVLRSSFMRFDRSKLAY